MYLNAAAFQEEKLKTEQNLAAHWDRCESFTRSCPLQPSWLSTKKQQDVIIVNHGRIS